MRPIYFPLDISMVAPNNHSELFDRSYRKACLNCYSEVINPILCTRRSTFFTDKHDYVNTNTLRINLAGGIFYRPLDTLNSDNAGL